MPPIVIVGDCVRSGRERVAARRLRQAEVEHLHDAVGRDLDVGRLQIAMDDALLVRRFERVGDLPRDGQRLADRRCGPVAMPIGERVAVDELEDQRGRAVHVLEAVDRADVRMIQRRPAAALRARSGRAARDRS